MSMIRPIDDLQDNYAEIARLAHETAQPVKRLWKYCRFKYGGL